MWWSRARTGFLEHADFKRLREALPEYLQAPFTLSYFTGMRLGNARSLEWSEVDPSANMLRIPAGKMKNDEPINIPLNAETRNVLASMSRKGPYVFPNLGQFRKSWRKACVQCKLGLFEEVGGRKVYVGLTWHDLRRSGVRNLILAGVPQHVCMLISGHKTASVFRRYAIVIESDLRAAADKLDSYLAQQETSACASDDTSLMKRSSFE